MNIDDLELCAAHVFRAARLRGVTAVDPGIHDLYWVVYSSDWTSMAREPARGVGSVRGDVLEIGKLIDAPERASAVDCDRLASLLRVLSAHMSGFPVGEK
ncbi:MAG: hypothetical protein ACO1OB_24700 [Archangium sp.]